MGAEIPTGNHGELFEGEEQRGRRKGIERASPCCLRIRNRGIGI